MEIVVGIIIVAMGYCAFTGNKLSVRYLNVIMNFYLSISFIYIANHYKRRFYYFFTVIYILMGIFWIFEPYI